MNDIKRKNRKYNFNEVRIFPSRADAVRARCAAHVLAAKREWKFKTKIRETDLGNFELTTTRIDK